mgnify:CR=1 FL=1
MACLKQICDNYKIKLNSTEFDSFSIDTKEDLNRARNLNI